MRIRRILIDEELIIFKMKNKIFLDTRIYIRKI